MDIFVASDNFAAHIHEALKKENYKIPTKNIKIVRFKHDPEFRIITPL